jgi:hypothetical protein
MVNRRAGQRVNRPIDASPPLICRSISIDPDPLTR